LPVLSPAFFIWLIISVLAPRFRLWIKPAPDIAGFWKYYDVIDGNRKEAGTAQFKQAGESLTATANRSKGRSGNDNVRSFIFKGKYSNGYVRLEFEEIGSGGLSVGNLTLYLSSNHNLLEGFTVYFDRDEGKVVAYPIVFERVN